MVWGFFPPPSYAQKIKPTIQLDRITLNVKEYQKKPTTKINLKLYAPSEYSGYVLCALFWVIGSNKYRAKYRNQEMFWGLSLQTSLFEMKPTAIQPTATSNLI